MKTTISGAVTLAATLTLMGGAAKAQTQEHWGWCRAHDAEGYTVTASYRTPIFRFKQYPQRDGKDVSRAFQRYLERRGIAYDSRFTTCYDAFSRAHIERGREEVLEARSHFDWRDVDWSYD